MYVNKASFSIIRSAATAAIGAAYATIGTALTRPATLVAFKNLTNGDVLVSTDGTNDYLAFPSGAHDIYEISSCSPPGLDTFMIPVGTQFYVKDGPTPSTTGSFYIEILEAVHPS